MSGDITGGEAQADMNDTKRRFFSGDTLQQALVQAANHFRLQPEEIGYQLIEKRHGFTKMRRKVVIEVDPAVPRRAAGSAPPPVPAAAPARSAAEPPAAKPAPASSAESRALAGTLTPREAAARERARQNPPTAPGAGRPERPGRPERSDRPERSRRPSGSYPRERQSRHARPQGAGRFETFDPPEPVAAAEDLVTLPERPRSIGERYPAAEGPQAEAAAKGVELLLRIAGLNLTPHIYRSEERLEIELIGADTDWCFADDGELLMAIEHLLPRIIRSLSGEAVLCRVDCDNFHEIREERLRSLAQRVADEVRQRGRPRTLVPMNPADRRIVHVTLADDSGVVTESEGDGYFKRITVRPA